MNGDTVTRLLESIDSKLTSQNSILSDVQNRVTRLETLQESNDDSRESVQSDLNGMKQEIVSIREDVASVKVKTGIWGAIFGFCFAAVSAVWAWIKA